MAALSALAEQNTEMALLAQASAVGGLTLLQFVQRNLRNVSATNATDAAFQYQQLLNATCACGGVPVNGSTSVTWLQNGTLLQAFNNSVNGTTDWTTYQARVCTPEFGAGGAHGSSACRSLSFSMHGCCMLHCGSAQLGMWHARCVRLWRRSDAAPL